MTSEVDELKTNEFLRRRKLRLQQVREQSKDIAKKIRQRAKVENLRQVIELDSKKQKEYLQHQEKLVKKLEEYYRDGIENVGVSHRNASEVRLQEGHGDKIDLSKQRGKEAAAELRKKRQQVLDKQKKLLEIKLQAREAANEISRDKSAAVLNKLQSKPANKATEEVPSKTSVACSDKNGYTEQGDENRDVVRNDMATQWDLEEIPNEWEPNIPTLSLPKDDNSVKESNNNNIDSKLDKSKKLDLFALSEEMPSSLRGGLTNQEERIPVKSSLTLVSEYLQNRGLRLREPDTIRPSKKIDDMQSLKQTILRTRVSKEVSAKGNIDKPFKSSTESSNTPKKSSVTLYNHVTRNSKDIPYHDERLVVRDLQDVDDAYSLAMKESTSNHPEGKDHHKKIEEMRSKVAMTKQNVEKEYRDTISFLNALPKDQGNKPIKNAYMDEQRQQMQKEMRQQKLQNEYRKIEKECKKHNCRNRPQKPKSPARRSDVFESTDFQYSWMPVPESDGNLAIHTIPTTLKDGKSGNNVKFSKVDSYHEYRSRHKHTPPTKETTQEKPRHVEAVVIDNYSDTDTSSDSTIDNFRQRNKNTPDDSKEKLSDAERIIIYKVLDTKTDKRRKTSKLMKELAKSLTSIDKDNTEDNNNQSQKMKDKTAKSNSENMVSFEQLNEGVYEAVNQNGDNITSMYFRNEKGESLKIAAEELQHVHPCSCKKILSQDQQQRIATTPQQWVSGSDDKYSRPIPRSHMSYRPPECNCPEKASTAEKINPAVQPSNVTSSTSYKSATNEKTVNTVSDGSFIKLIDSGGVEAGKFYIGASGLLRNEAYEVVIQLRKKGDEKEIPSENPEDNKKQGEALIIEKTSAVSATQTSLVEVETIENKKEPIVTAHAVTEPSKVKAQTESARDAVVSATSEVSPSATNSSLTKPRKDISSRSVDVTNNELNERQVSEKGVSTAFQDADTHNVPKSIPVPRPATSTYTQTSMSSPNHRPVFLHMSSSTSTAYMSPPELIMPKFLRQGHILTDQDINDPRNYDTGEMEFTEQHEYSEIHDSCRCRKCLLSKKFKLSKHATAQTHRCRKFTYQNAKTPPNTGRSGCTSDIEQMYLNRKDEEFAVLLNKKSKHMCHKCKNHSFNTGEHSNCKKKIHHSMRVKHLSRNRHMRVASSAASTNNIASSRSKTDLKPIIKKYIDKLLVLNKETLKAVQVIDQDCSSVTTPGSSVIDVPKNVDRDKPTFNNKLSLQEIQSLLKEKIRDNSGKTHHETDDDTSIRNSDMYTKKQISQHIKIPKLPRKKTAHKVKSLNISKKLSGLNNTIETRQVISTKKGFVRKEMSSMPSKGKFRSKSSPTPRLTTNPDSTNRSANSDSTHLNFRSRKNVSKYTKSTNTNEQQSEACQISESSNRATSSTSPDSERDPNSLKRDNVRIPMSISTQTSINVDTEINFMEIAADKLQNIEKIADMTEKCTKRLSNLAKVLEEVRKNKTLVYSHISTSDTTSDSDQKSDKNANKIPVTEAPTLNNIGKRSESKSPENNEIDTLKENNNTITSNDYVPFLSNIPKPVAFKNVNSDLELNSSSSSSRKSRSPSPVHEIVDQPNKHKGKPPPALSRIHLKHGQNFIVPHELSTVVEVDSPMSIKLKSSRNDTKIDHLDTSNRNNGMNKDGRNKSPLFELSKGDTNDNPELLDDNVEMLTEQLKNTPTGSTDNSKIQMIDLKQFNEIMLKPFFSLQEYAKQCDVGDLVDGSNFDDIVKDDQINEELSSFHSEASLPDVISELLKRNIISEPFKFDTGSNANSTTVSSGSNVSVLALSKARQAKKKSGVLFRNKENFAETSDSMSISSNPDLENAFKKLGMGWASSTLKKTKEHLALSSSSNTSSSSLSQFKVKSFNQEIPVIVTETVSSVLNLSKPPLQSSAADNSKNAAQQTSMTNSMTVKEFLTNELAKKITFNNKSKNETEAEFVSLFETKMPEEMKHSSLMVREENYSNDNSRRSGNNRARTSTPVQLFKSMTYHSSSSSNMSNGLFSNADDLSSVQVTSNSMKHSTSDKDDLIIPNFSLRMKRGSSDCSKSD